MPAATVLLLSLSDQATLPALLRHVQANSAPLVISKPVRWVIRPEKIDTRLLETRWDMLVILESTPKSQDFLLSLTSTQSPAWTEPRSFTIVAHWFATVGIPSRLSKDFLQKNQSLLHPESEPTLAGISSQSPTQSSQDLTLSHDLQQWIKTRPVSGAVSMLNLLAFKPGQKENYLKYGKAFGETIGAKRGGNAKLVGNVIHDGTKAKGDGKWDEFALAQYPSLDHFAEMLASKDYQEVNQKYRVPSLFDTCILCTSELEIESMVKAKL